MAAWQFWLHGWSNVSSTASFEQAASWSATSAEEFINPVRPYNASGVKVNDRNTNYGKRRANATWSQTASWSAAAAETFSGAGTFVQTATWEATGSTGAGSGVTGTGTWNQTASWAASATETFTGTGSFAQTAAWSASGAQAFTGTGTFSQAQSWDASATETFTSADASWTQTASWAASEVAAPSGGVGGSLGRLEFMPWPWHKQPPDIEVDRLPKPAAIVGTASFVQQPASWRADMDTYDPNILALLFDEPALIGAR